MASGRPRDGAPPAAEDAAPAGEYTGGSAAVAGGGSAAAVGGGSAAAVGGGSSAVCVSWVMMLHVYCAGSGAPADSETGSLV